MVSFDEIMKSLFYNKTAWYVDMFGKIKSNKTTLFADRNNCTSQAKIEKWLCINDLINISTYYNQDWTPDWTNFEEKKYAIVATDLVKQEFGVIEINQKSAGFVVFKSAKDAQNAIDVLKKEKLVQIFLT